MFISNGLTFIDSANIKVFPCGRRRSLVNDGEASDKLYLPFDAEARLNTEANNRKHSSLNGYKQSFVLAYESGILSLVIGGYLFEIQLDDTLGNFANSFGTDAEAIYANIKLEDIMLFAGTADGTVPKAKTKILRDQTLEQVPETCLDIPYTSGDTINYYFSGLSFSTKANVPKETSSIQQVISLLVLEKVTSAAGATWQLCEQSKLPNIDHGTRENSVKVGILEADAIDVSGAVKAGSVEIGENGDKVVMLRVEKTTNDTYQLNFFHV